MDFATAPELRVSSTSRAKILPIIGTNLKKITSSANTCYGSELSMHLSPQFTRKWNNAKEQCPYKAQIPLGVSNVKREIAHSKTSLKWEMGKTANGASAHCYPILGYKISLLIHQPVLLVTERL